MCKMKRPWTTTLLSLAICMWTLATTGNACPAGWTEEGGLCYGVINATRVLTSVYEARQLCQSYGADLPDVSAEYVVTMITSLITSQADGSESVFIGLNDIATEGTFVYGESNNTTQYNRWTPGHPDSSGSGNASNCVLLNGASGKWSNIACCQSLGISFAACQKPNDTNVAAVDTDIDVFAKTCFQDVDECGSNPCMHGATCQDHVLYYECDCAAGYNGTQCQYDACTPDPCQNSRPCSLSGVSYSCDCGDWFNGTNCENIASQCYQQLCQNNATCAGDPNSYQCTCLPGFVGTHCETNINECENVTCGAHGTCVDGVNSYSCRCDPGYGGATCSQEISCSPLMVANATSPNATSVTPYNYNEMLVFSCLEGHKFPDMDVTKTTTCTGQGWTPALSSCDLHCATIPTVGYASVLNGNTLVGTTVNYTCDTGYQFPDNSTVLSVQCLSPGNWSNLDIPDCEVVKCPELPTFPYQELDTRNNTYNTLITFWCDIGYELHDHTTARTIKCLSTGEWTADLPPCQPVKCPEINLATIPGNTRNSSAVEYDSYVEYQCESNKRMVDGSTYRVVRCDAMAEWSDNITDCDSNRCFPLPYVGNSTPSSLDAFFGSVVTLTCITGHRFFIGSQKYASRSMTCSSNGRWNPILSACEPIICPDLPIPTKASLSTDNTLFATVVNVTCDQGHYYNTSTMEKVRWSRCLENGQWDVVITDPCIAIPCPEAPDIFNGTRTGGSSGYVYADQVQYDCGDGFKFVDGRVSKSIQCTAEGTWDDTDMSCRKDRCDPVPSVRHTEPDTRNTSWGTEVVFTCTPGYEWPGNTMEYRITCNVGTWVGPTIPECDPKVCPVIMKMENATLNGTDAEDDRLYSTVIEYSCDIGYKYPDNETVKYRRCDESGQWAPTDAAFPVCEIIICPELGDVENATRDSNATEYGATVNYVCDQGYQYPTKELSLPIYCTENATWTAYPPPCEVVFCPPLPLWNEAYFNDTSNEFEAVVNYSCKPEFIFEDFTYNAEKVKVADDEKLSICMTDKTWQPPIVNCREIKGIADDLAGVVYESPNSVSIGTLAITLLSLVGALLLCLDANKLYGDLKIMKTNVSYCVEKRNSRISSTTNIQCEEVGESTA